MAINGIGDSYLLGGSVFDAKSLSEENSTLSITDFFTLLSAELQNQTMYDSVDSSQYMTQLVQYTILSQLQELSAASGTAYAVSLLGKEVSVVGEDSLGNETLVTGRVEDVAFQGKKAYIRIDGAYYDPADVLRLGNGA